MARSTTERRWMEGAHGRVLHALGLWACFVAVVHFSRLVLFPAFGFPGAIAGVVFFYGVVLGLLLMKVGRVNLRDLGYTLEGWPRELLLGLAGFVAISGMLLCWVLAIHGVEQVEHIFAKIAGYSLADHAMFFFIGLLASSAEETLYRGYMQPVLMARFGALAGIGITVVLFAAGHFADWPTVSRVGSLIITGLGFGVLRWRRRPLIASFTAHTLLWMIWGTA
jgi:uncharacterized protein